MTLTIDIDERHVSDSVSKPRSRERFGRLCRYTLGQSSHRRREATSRTTGLGVGRGITISDDRRALEEFKDYM